MSSDHIECDLQHWRSSRFFILSRSAALARAFSIMAFGFPILASIALSSEGLKPIILEKKEGSILNATEVPLVGSSRVALIYETTNFGCPATYKG